MLGFFRSRRRRRLLASPFPDDWREILRNNVRHYTVLGEEERRKLEGDLRVVVAEKYWEGCAGLAMTDEIRVTIAALACLLVLARPHDYFANVDSILVYPGSYFAPQREVVTGGIVVEGRSHRLGEAWSVGPVVLSWDDVRRGGRWPADGHNVVLHEFAHKLDLMSGGVDGVPRLEGDREYERWAEVMSAEYALLLAQMDQGYPTFLDDYAATNPGEFFAVATECFFERPLGMQDRHPRLYEVLRGYYRQDPAAREPATRTGEEQGEVIGG